MNARSEEVFFRNNTGNKSKTSLVDGFVVRTKEFEQIFNEIKASRSDKPEQHYLVIGQRGAGKTTLIYRLKYAIEDDLELSPIMIPIMFAEEQYSITELANLWENIAEYLGDGIGWDDLSSMLREEEYNYKDYEERIFLLLENSLKKRGQKIIVFIENLNVLFKKIGGSGQQRLREVLTTTNYIRVIGTSTEYFDGITDYSLPFYDFFKIIELGGLDKKEAIKLLIRIGEQHGASDEIKQVIKDHPGRVESLRRLTGGIPRTISYLFQIFLDNENGKAIKDLYQLIDNLSLLYKSELDQLSAQQQKVVDVIARNWDAISVKEIVTRTRYESKNVSSILSVLQKSQMIEAVSTRNKNNLYRMKERFMNIWYLMRFGRKHDKDNVVWLVRFFDAWCDETELARRVNQHMKNLMDGKYDVNAAIDMGNTFLSCENVSHSLKYSLYAATKSILPEKLSKAVRVSNEILFNKVNELIDKHDFSGADDLIEEIDRSDKFYYIAKHWLFLGMRRFTEAIDVAHQLLELDPNNALAEISLGIVYEDYLYDISKAEYYLKRAWDHKHPYAACRLGQISFYHKNDLKKAIEYHQQAIKRGFKTSMLFLAEIFLKVNDLKKAEMMYQEAITANISDAHIGLGNVFFQKKAYKKAEDMYMKAVSVGEVRGLIRLGVLYRTKRKPDIEKAKVYFEKAIEAKLKQGYYLLGKLYLEDFKKRELAVETLYKGVEEKDAESAHFLAHYFEKIGEYDKSDDLFLKAVEWGKAGALLCLVDSIYLSNRKEKREYALELLNDNLPRVRSFIGGSVVYSRILLWNDEIQKSVENFRSEYEEIRLILNRGDNDFGDSRIRHVLESIADFMLLLLAKEQYNICLSLFKDISNLDFKMLLKPIYFVLMEFFKEEYPQEYLKAGDELKETIIEIKDAIKQLKKRVVS